FSMCIAFDLSILNGCLDGDVSGRFTFVSSAGSSVVDYFVVSQDILPLCTSLAVEESVVSPHMCLELCIAGKGRKMNKESNNIITTKIVWDCSSCDVYTENLRSSLSLLENQNFLSGENTDIEASTEGITRCFTNSAVFLQKTFVKRERRQVNAWYDKDCIIAKREANRQLRKYMHTRDR
ncbi:MAG: hypothetical protein DSZ28_02375, partial [Thiothrix sp.]